MALNYVAHCIACGKDLEEGPNGIFADAAAKNHHEDTGHVGIIVGYWAVPKNTVDKVARTAEDLKLVIPAEKV